MSDPNECDENPIGMSDDELSDERKAQKLVQDADILLRDAIGKLLDAACLSDLRKLALEEYAKTLRDTRHDDAPSISIWTDDIAAAMRGE